MVPPTQGCVARVGGGGGGGGGCMPFGNQKLLLPDSNGQKVSLTLDRTLQYYFRSMAIYGGGGGGGGGKRGEMLPDTYVITSDSSDGQLVLPLCTGPTWDCLLLCVSVYVCV